MVVCGGLSFSHTLSMACQAGEVKYPTHTQSGGKCGAGLNDGLFQKRCQTLAVNRDFTVCIIRCVYRAELIFGR